MTNFQKVWAGKKMKEFRAKCNSIQYNFIYIVQITIKIPLALLQRPEPV